jgi:hypothetical protein
MGGNLNGTLKDSGHLQESLPHMTEQYSLVSSTGEAMEILPRLGEAGALLVKVGPTMAERLPHLGEATFVAAHIPAAVHNQEMLPHFVGHLIGGQFSTPSSAAVGGGVTLKAKVG